MKYSWLLLLALINLVSCKQDNNDIDLGLIPVKSGDKWGYIDHAGKFEIHPQFLEAYTFSDGLALVQTTDKKFGYINKDGKFVIAAIYKDALGFAEGRAVVVKENEGLECINEKGERVFRFGKNVEEANSFSEKMVLYSVNGKYGFCNYSGGSVIALEYSFASGFKEGLARVSIYDSMKQHNSFGFINTAGKNVIDFQFEYADDFHNGLAVISVNRKYGYIDRAGKSVITPQFDYAAAFNGDFALIRLGDLFGFINKKGEMIIKPQYASAGDFDEGGFAIAGEKNEPLGYIDERGNFAIKPKFDDATKFFGDIAIAGINKKFGVINKTGKFIVDPQFEAIHITPDNPHYIAADDVDLDGIADYVIDKTSANRFHDLDSTVTYSELVQKFPGLNENNYSAFSLNDDMGHPQIKLQKIAFEFYGGILKYDGPATMFHDYGEDAYITVPEETGEKGYLNDQAHIFRATFFYKLGKQSYNKKDKIVAAILEQLKTHYSLAEVEPVSSSEEANNYQLENNNYRIRLSFSKDDSHILEVTVRFKQPNE